MIDDNGGILFVPIAAKWLASRTDDTYQSQISLFQQKHCM